MLFFLTSIFLIHFIHPEAAEQNVQQLSVEQLSEIQSSTTNVFWFVKFFRPGFPQCEQLAPDYVRMAQSLKGNPAVKFGEIDCTGSDVCNRNNIPNLPTLRFYHKGISAEYKGLYNAASITPWIEEQLVKNGNRAPPPPLPTSKYITNMSSELFNTAKSNHSAIFWVVYFYRLGCSHCERFTADFVTLADTLYNIKDVRFGQINCPENKYLCDTNFVESVPTLRLYYKGSYAQHGGPRDGGESTASLTHWVKKFIAEDGHLILHPPAVAPLPTSKHIVPLDYAGLIAAKADTAHFWVVKFKQNDCSHCVDFAQTYVDLVDAYALRNGQDPSIKFAEVDCRTGGPSCMEERIVGVPSVRLYYRGVWAEYRGLRAIEPLTLWIDNHVADNGELLLHPLVSPNVVDFEEHDRFLDVLARDAGPRSNNFWVVKYGHDTCIHCKTLAPIYLKIADTLNVTTPNLKFGSVDCGIINSACDAENVQTVPTIRIHYKGARLEYAGVREYEQLVDWIRESMDDDGDAILHQPEPPPPPPGQEFVETLNWTSFAAVKGATNTRFTVVKFFRHDCSHCVPLIPVYISLAESLRDTPNLLVAEVDCTAFASMCNQNSIEGVPTIRIYYKGLYLDYSGTRTVEAFTEWIHGSMENEGEKILNPPPPPPPPPTSRYILELNAVSLLDAKAKDTDVFWVVKFYRRGCPHCDRLEPDFVSLADMLGSAGDLKFGQVNCPTLGDLCKKNEVRGVPTLRIYYKGEFLEYNGNRNVSSMESWIDAAMADNGSMITDRSNLEL